MNASQPKSMTLAELTEYYDSDLATMISEQYWSDGVDTEALFNALLRWAASDDITVTDADTVDYDTLLYDIYQNDPDKGLS